MMICTTASEWRVVVYNSCLEHVWMNVGLCMSGVFNRWLC